MSLTEKPLNALVSRSFMRTPFAVSSGDAEGMPTGSGFWLPSRRDSLLAEPVARHGVEIQGIDLLQVADDAPALRTERGFAFEGVEDDSLEEVPEGDVVVFRQALQDLQDALLDAHARLDSFDLDLASRTGRCLLHRAPPCGCAGLPASTAFIASCQWPSVASKR